MTEPAPEMDGVHFEVGGARQDALFSVLSHQYRRFVLRYLGAAETPISVAELTTELATWESNRAVADRSRDDRTAIEIALLHNHLPTMADAGIISYDTDRQLVTVADRADEAERYLSSTV